MVGVVCFERTENLTDECKFLIGTGVAVDKGGCGRGEEDRGAAEESEFVVALREGLGVREAQVDLVLEEC
jgi:hypothetical protein